MRFQIYFFCTVSLPPPRPFACYGNQSLFLRSYFFSIKQETDWDRIIKYFAILKYHSQSLSIFRNHQISFAIVKYRSELSNMIRNRQSRFLYILREVFCFDSIAYVLPPNPIRIPPIQTSTTCTIALFTIPRIEIFDPDLHRVSGSAWTFSCCRERTRRQRESIHCLAHVRRQYKLWRCCALSHALEIWIPSSFFPPVSLPPPRPFASYEKQSLTAFLFFVLKKYLKR